MLGTRRSVIPATGLTEGEAAERLARRGPLPPVQTSRSYGSIVRANVFTIFNLILVVFGTVRSGRSVSVAYAVGGYITAAYWFTSSTSFANPAVTVARMFSDTFAGIAPASVPLFVLMQLLGGLAALALVKVLHPQASRLAAELVAVER